MLSLEYWRHMLSLQYCLYSTELFHLSAFITLLVQCMLNGSGRPQSHIFCQLMMVLLTVGTSSLFIFTCAHLRLHVFTLCAYAQQGYAFGRVGLCAYVRTYVYIYIYVCQQKKQAV